MAVNQKILNISTIILTLILWGLQMSGCMYSCQYRDGATFDQLHELQIKFLGNNSTVRYQNNVSNFIKLIEEIMSEVEKRQSAEKGRQRRCTN